MCCMSLKERKASQKEDHCNNKKIKQQNKTTTNKHIIVCLQPKGSQWLCLAHTVKNIMLSPKSSDFAILIHPPPPCLPLSLPFLDNYNYHPNKSITFNAHSVSSSKYLSSPRTNKHDETHKSPASDRVL